VKEEAGKLADEYNNADNGKDDGYVTLLHSVPEELSCIWLYILFYFFTKKRAKNMVNFPNWNFVYLVQPIN